MRVVSFAIALRLGAVAAGSGAAQTRRAFANAVYLAMSQPFAAGALCSTVGDLAALRLGTATVDLTVSERDAELFAQIQGRGPVTSEGPRKP